MLRLDKPLKLEHKLPQINPILFCKVNGGMHCKAFKNYRDVLLGSSEKSSEEKTGLMHDYRCSTCLPDMVPKVNYIAVAHAFAKTMGGWETYIAAYTMNVTRTR